MSLLKSRKMFDVLKKSIAYALLVRMCVLTVTGSGVETASPLIAAIKGL